MNQSDPLHEKDEMVNPPHHSYEQLAHFAVAALRFVSALLSPRCRRPALLLVKSGSIMSFVSVEQRGPVTIVAMNRPEKLDAINKQVALDLQ